MGKETYLLIHGSYHGAWCWDEVKQGLEENEHAVHAIDLPGHGNDSTPRNLVSIELYIDKIREFIEKNRLMNIILVGHSMGGVVVSQLVERVPSRIKHVIFIGGVILDNGECFLDLIPKWRQELYRKMAVEREDRSIPINAEFVRNCFLNECTYEKINEVLKKLTPQPFIHDTKIYLKEFHNLKIPITYIKCKKDNSLTVESFIRIISRLPKHSKIIEIDSDHEPMFSRPEELIQLLNKIPQIIPL